MGILVSVLVDVKLEITHGITGGFKAVDLKLHHIVAVFLGKIGEIVGLPPIECDLIVGLSRVSVVGKRDEDGDLGAVNDIVFICSIIEECTPFIMYDELLGGISVDDYFVSSAFSGHHAEAEECKHEGEND